jgi:hypothetical protein
MKIEAACTSETSATMFISTQCKNPRAEPTLKMHRIVLYHHEDAIGFGCSP